MMVREGGKREGERRGGEEGEESRGGGLEGGTHPRYAGWPRRHIRRLGA